MAHKVNRWKGLLYQDQDYQENELLRKWKVKEGQLWRLGKHLLYVGDARSRIARYYLRTNQTDVTDAETQIGVCTDPPYDLEVSTIAKVIGRYAGVAVMLMSDNIAWNIGAYLEPRLSFVWIHDEPRSINADSRPVYYHNHILVLAGDKDVKTGWRRPRPNFSSVIYVGTRAYYKNHGKGVYLFEEMIAGFKKWKVVVDPFLGYGTTILAAENLGKRCQGVEKQPAVAAVALERVSEAGICKPVLVGEVLNKKGFKTFICRLGGKRGNTKR